jgi:hypothetical protein
MEPIDRSTSGTHRQLGKVIDLKVGKKRTRGAVSRT